MARPKKTGRRKQISTLLDWYYYDFLKRQAEKQGMSISNLVKGVLEKRIDNWQGGTIVAGLEKEQLQELERRAKAKGMSVNEFSTRILCKYLEV